MTGERFCMRCGIKKPLAQFRPDPDRPVRRCSTKCLDCEAISGPAPSRLSKQNYCSDWDWRRKAKKKAKEGAA